MIFKPQKGEPIIVHIAQKQIRFIDNFLLQAAKEVSVGRRDVSLSQFLSSQPKHEIAATMLESDQSRQMIERLSNLCSPVFSVSSDGRDDYEFLAKADALSDDTNKAIEDIIYDHVTSAAVTKETTIGRALEKAGISTQPDLSVYSTDMQNSLKQTIERETIRYGEIITHVADRILKQHHDAIASLVAKMEKLQHVHSLLQDTSTGVSVINNYVKEHTSLKKTLMADPKSLSKAALLDDFEHMLRQVKVTQYMTLEDVLHSPELFYKVFKSSALHPNAVSVHGSPCIATDYKDYFNGSLWDILEAQQVIINELTKSLEHHLEELPGDFEQFAPVSDLLATLIGISLMPMARRTIQDSVTDARRKDYLVVKDLTYRVKNIKVKTFTKKTQKGQLPVKNNQGKKNGKPVQSKQSKKTITQMVPVTAEAPVPKSILSPGVSPAVRIEELIGLFQLSAFQVKNIQEKNMLDLITYLDESADYYKELYAVFMNRFFNSVLTSRISPYTLRDANKGRFNFRAKLPDMPARPYVITKVLNKVFHLNDNGQILPWLLSTGVTLINGPANSAKTLITCALLNILYLKQARISPMSKELTPLEDRDFFISTDKERTEFRFDGSPGMLSADLEIITADAAYDLAGLMEKISITDARVVVVNSINKFVRESSIEYSGGAETGGVKTDPINDVLATLNEQGEKLGKAIVCIYRPNNADQAKLLTGNISGQIRTELTLIKRDDSSIYDLHIIDRSNGDQSPDHATVIKDPKGLILASEASKARYLGLFAAVPSAVEDLPFTPTDPYLSNYDDDISEITHVIAARALDVHGASSSGSTQDTLNDNVTNERPLTIERAFVKNI